jgi:hypothetical protein
VIRLYRQIFILPLVACLLLVPALASPAMVTHEAQHAHHKAATHSSALCTWLCGVGQGFETCSIQLSSIFHSFDLLGAHDFDEVLAAVTTPRFFRGPPAISQ